MSLHDPSPDTLALLGLTEANIAPEEVCWLVRACEGISLTKRAV